MKESLNHLFWGIMLSTLFVILNAFRLPLMRLCGELSLDHALAFIFLGELASILPLSGVIWKEWSLKNREEWIAYGLLAALFPILEVANVYCSLHMFLGDFAAIATGSIGIFVPIMTLAFHRRCVSVAEGLSMVLLVIGIILVAQPNFIFGKIEAQSGTPAQAYILAFLTTLPMALSYFVIGHFPYVHWSTYLFTRTVALGIAVVIYLIVGIKQQQKTAHGMLYPKMDAWVSVLGALMVGLIANVYRISQVYGCQEFEKFGKGNAGIMGNFLYTGHIFFSAVYAWIFYGEVMTPLALVGAALIAAAIILVTSIKARKRVLAEEEEGKDKEKEDEWTIVEERNLHDPHNTEEDADRNTFASNKREHQNIGEKERLLQLQE